MVDIVAVAPRSLEQTERLFLLWGMFEGQTSEDQQPRQHAAGCHTEESFAGLAAS